MNLEQLQQIAQLDKLKAQGILSADEYDVAKARIVAKPPPPQLTPTPATPPTPATDPGNKARITIAVILVVCTILVFILNAIYSPDKSRKASDSTATGVATLAQLKKDSVSLLEQNAANKASLAKAKAAVKSLRPLARYRKDDFSGGFFHNKLAPRFINANGIDVSFNYLDNAVGPGDLNWSFQYFAEDWLFIESYQFLIDGQQYTFVPSEVKRDNGDGMIWEWFSEPVDTQSLEILNAISTAKSVKVRINGKDYHDDKVVTAAQRADIKNLLALHNALKVLHAQP